MEQLGERGRRIEVGHDDGRGHHLAFTQLHADDRTTLDHNAGHLDVAPQLATVLLEQPGEVVCDGAQSASHLRHGGRPGRGESEGEAESTPGREGAPEGRVDGEEGKHAAHRCVLHRVRQELVHHIHDTAEHGGADGLTL